MKLVFAVVLLAACSTTDDRPPTLAYITETIFVPSCSSAFCHSEMKRAGGYAFDSVDAANASIASYPLIEQCAMPPCPSAPGNSYLLTVITNADVYGNRMPLDQPLPNLDAVLIAQWITDGAPGYQP